MIKTLKNLFKQDKERYTVPRKVQDVIPVRRIWKDGIFLTGGKFAKTYKFTDINYLVASREDIVVGDVATFIEAKAESELAAPVVADQTGSISNELLCRIGARLPVIEK